MKTNTREELMGAVARGWGHPANANKVMDTDLALAITEELEALIEKEKKEIIEKIKEMGPDVVVPGLNETYIMKSKVLDELDK